MNEIKDVLFIDLFYDSAQLNILNKIGAIRYRDWGFYFEFVCYRANLYGGNIVL